MTQLVSRSEMARQAGVSAAAVTKVCKTLLAAACVGKRIDLEHQAAIEYLKNRAPASTAKAVVKGHAAANLTKKTDRSRPGGDDPLQNIPEDIRQFSHLSLADLCIKFGTDTAFVDWLKATKAIEDIHEKRLKNAEKEGELIARRIVQVGILDVLDGAWTRMLTDGAKTIAVRTAALVKSGATPVELEDLVSHQLSTFIKPTKSKMARAIRNA